MISKGTTMMQGDYPGRITESPQRVSGEEGIQPAGETLPDAGVASTQQEFANVGRLDRILFSIEKREIVSALRNAAGQRSLAARALGISRSRLYRRMEALGIDPEALESGPDSSTTMDE